MTSSKPEEIGNDGQVLTCILEAMIEADETITARAVARKHPVLKSASSITRNADRTSLLAKYQTQQKQFRAMRDQMPKRSRDQIAAQIAQKDARIAELERQVEVLTVSHLAMIRAVGELGGIGKWMKFYAYHREVRDELNRLGVLPKAEIMTIHQLGSER